MAAADRAPTADLDSAGFWDGLRRHVVVVQACAACHRHRFGRLGACPYCGAPGGADIEIAGTGSVYTFVRVHRALTAEMTGDVPYVVGTIDLDGGARMLGRVEPPADVTIGARVRPEFVDHETWTELRFVIEAPA